MTIQKGELAPTIFGLAVLGLFAYLLIFTTFGISLTVFLALCAVLGCAGLSFCKTYQRKRADIGSPAWFQVGYQLHRLFYYLTQLIVYFLGYVAAFLVWPYVRELVCYVHPICSGSFYYFDPNISEWLFVGTLGWCATIFGGGLMYEAVTGERDI